MRSLSNVIHSDSIKWSRVLVGVAGSILANVVLAAIGVQMLRLAAFAAI